MQDAHIDRPRYLLIVSPSCRDNNVIDSDVNLEELAKVRFLKHR
jgi:hypothetical protein